VAVELRDQIQQFTDKKIGTLESGRLMEGGRLIGGRLIEVRLYLHINQTMLNPLTPGTFFSKQHFLDILSIFGLHMSQIFSNQLRKGIVTWPHASPFH